MFRGCPAGGDVLVCGYGCGTVAAAAAGRDRTRQDCDMELIHAMNDLAAAIGMRPVEPEESGGFTLLFDGEHEVAFVPDGSATFFHAVVGEAADLDREALLSLLEASLLGADTDGAAFGIHKALGEVVLWKRYGEFSGKADLETAIHAFLGQVLEWKRRLAEGRFALPTADTPFPSAFGVRFLQV